MSPRLQIWIVVSNQQIMNNHSAILSKIYESWNVYALLMSDEYRVYALCKSIRLFLEGVQEEMRFETIVLLTWHVLISRVRLINSVPLTIHV